MAGDRDLMDRIRDAERASRIEDAKARETRLGHEPVRPSKAAPPAAVPAASAGDRIVLDGPNATLGGRELHPGAVIEVYTNAANGWLRGRYERADGGPPRLAVHVWDLLGARDEDGLPPWTGELDAPLPLKATCRWPVG
jgi:hypothetical protein